MKYLSLIILALALAAPVQAAPLSPEICLEMARTFLIAAEANSPQTDTLRARLGGCFAEEELGLSTVALIHNDAHIQYTLSKAEEAEKESVFTGL